MTPLARGFLFAFLVSLQLIVPASAAEDVPATAPGPTYTQPGPTETASSRPLMNSDRGFRRERPPTQAAPT
jgi:hypothetical protein